MEHIRPCGDVFSLVFLQICKPNVKPIAPLRGRPQMHLPPAAPTAPAPSPPNYTCIGGRAEGEKEGVRWVRDR